LISCDYCSAASSGQFDSQAAASKFTKGDVIRVVRGDLAKLTGSVVSVVGNIVRMQPNHPDLKVRSGGLWSRAIRHVWAHTVVT